jgi:hypothetical protein
MKQSGGGKNEKRRGKELNYKETICFSPTLNGAK